MRDLCQMERGIAVTKLVSPSSPLLDDLGRVRRVQAKPAYVGRFARLDKAACGQGRVARGGRRGKGTRRSAPAPVNETWRNLPNRGETNRMPVDL